MVDSPEDPNLNTDSNNSYEEPLLPSIHNVFHKLTISRNSNWEEIKKITDKYNSTTLDNIIKYTHDSKDTPNDIEYGNLIKQKSINLTTILRIAVLIGLIEKPNNIPKAIYRYMSHPHRLISKINKSDWIAICNLSGIKTDEDILESKYVLKGNNLINRTLKKLPTKKTTTEKPSTKPTTKKTNKSTTKKRITRN